MILNKDKTPELWDEIQKRGKDSALAKQFVPSPLENSDIEEGKIDPIGDSVHKKIPGLIHRYPHKVLLLVTHHCPVTCRFCFRKNLLHDPTHFSLKESLNYVKDHEEIHEIILSGGDPLVYSDEKLLELFKAFSLIPHVKYARIHTKIPMVQPSRITKELIEIFKEVKKLYKRFLLVVHINHSQDLYPSSVNALKSLIQEGIEIKSQSVLLKGVNDNSSTLINLFEDLIEIGVNPYYLHHTDPVKGAMHFMVDLEEGKKIFREVKKNLPSWACPSYVIEQENGAGKIDVFSNPNN